MLGLLSKKALQFQSGPDRDAFLRLLDRDLSPLVYCAPCRTLHDPRLTTWCKDPHQSKPFVPRFNIVHAVMRNARAGKSCAELIAAMEERDELLCHGPMVGTAVGNVRYRVVRRSGQLCLMMKHEALFTP